MRELSLVVVLVTLGCATSERAHRSPLGEARDARQEAAALGAVRTDEASRQEEELWQRGPDDSEAYEAERLRRALADVTPGRTLRVSLAPAQTLKGPYQGLGAGALRLGEEPPGATIPIERVQAVAVRGRAIGTGATVGAISPPHLGLSGAVRWLLRSTGRRSSFAAGVAT